MKLTENLLTKLSQNGFIVVDEFCSSAVCQEVLAIFEKRQNEFSCSSIGRNLAKEYKPEIRKSLGLWLEEKDLLAAPCLTDYNMRIHEWMLGINDYFRLAIKRIETQLSHYRPGDYYKKHIDQHHKSRHRLMTSVLYLNELNSGGELNIFSRDNSEAIVAKVRPWPGRLVVFISGEIYHEVSTTLKNRYSINSWMRDDEIVPFT